MRHISVIYESVLWTFFFRELHGSKLNVDVVLLYTEGWKRMHLENLGDGRENLEPMGMVFERWSLLSSPVCLWRGILRRLKGYVARYEGLVSIQVHLRHPKPREQCKEAWGEWSLHIESWVETVVTLLTRLFTDPSRWIYSSSWRVN